MAPNETSALLKNYCDQQYASACNYQNGGGYHALDDNNHIVYVNKEVSECRQPIFCINEYSSSLTLDELLPYKLDPWWQNLRRILFLTFWLIFLITLLTACLLSYLQMGHSSCNVLEKPASTNSLEMSTSSSSSILAAATTFPTSITKILST